MTMIGRVLYVIVLLAVNLFMACRVLQLPIMFTVHTGYRIATAYHMIWHKSQDKFHGLIFSIHRNRVLPQNWGRGGCDLTKRSAVVPPVLESLEQVSKFDRQADGHTYTTLVCGYCGHSHVFPNYCGDRFCPVCSAGRRVRARYKLQETLKKQPSANALTWRLITLTIRKGADCRAQCDKLIKSFRKLRSTSWWKHLIKGGIAVIEVTGRPNAWHVHLHMIAYGYFVPKGELSRRWEKVADGFIVDAKFIPHTALVYYVTKYITKSDVPDFCRQEVNKALKGRRLYQPFGICHGWAQGIPKHQFPCPDCKSNCWVIPDFCDGQYKHLLDALVRQHNRDPVE